MNTTQLAAVISILLLPSIAHAQDRFEIQVYDSNIAPKGESGLEVHVNTVVDGTHQANADGESATHHLTHITFEPHLGLTRWAELGMYFQTAVFADGRPEWAGFKVRLKSVFPHRFARGVIGLGLNIELSVVPQTFEANVWGSELRPIFDVRFRRLYFSVNPIIDIDLAGSVAGRPQLQPAAKLAVRVVSTLSVGAEYYAALGPVTGFTASSNQLHRIMGVIDYARELTKAVDLDLNIGAGYDLTGNGDRWVVKAIVGVGH